MSLTKEQRSALPESDFAVPELRKLPIHDETHVRLAHDMVDRTQGLSSEQKAEARRRILEKAHSLGVETASWEISASVSFEAMAIEMPDVPDHPNRMPFKGVLTRVDTPSDNPPGGSSGHCTIMPAAVAQAALPSLLGMAVDYTPKFDGHNRKAKIGIITAADVVGDALEIEGFFYAKDFPGECERIRAEKDALGFSFEVDARIQDADADPWTIESCVFTGAAVLYKDLAAYTTTSLSASAEEEGIDMNKEELQALLADAVKPLMAKIDAQAAEISELKAKGASLAGPIIDQVMPHVGALNACADGMEAAGIGNDSRSGHAGVVRKVAAHMAAAAVSGKIPTVYRDHDYLPSATVEAGADAEALKKLQDSVTASLEAMSTKMADLQAAAFAQAAAPARATISPAIATLLNKAGVNVSELEASGKKMELHEVDKVLDAQGLKGVARIEAKLKLTQSGLLDMGNKA